MKRRDFLTYSAATAGLLALNGLSVPEARAAGTLPSWVSNLPLWQWYQLPSTALSSVAPNPVPIGSSGSRSKMEAWCGATLKRSGSVYILGAAGGHADYAGNEVNALQLSATTPAWVQLKAPTPNASVIDRAQFYLDRRPAATHTYYATQFVDSANRMLIMPSPGLGGLGAAPPSDWPYMGSARTFSFNLATGDWDAPEYISQFTGNGDFTACLCVKHPMTEDIYYSRSYGDGWYRYSLSTNTWAKLSNASRAPWYAGVAMDPSRNRILVVGGYSPMAPEVRDLQGSFVSASFGGLGASALAVSGYPGLIFDEANDNFLVFYNSGSSIAVRRVHPTSWNVDAPAMTGIPPAARTNGIQNAVQYAPELGGFVLANSYSSNVYFVRTSLTGQIVPPLAAPTGLVVVP